ncbi:MAG: hypothetical protein JNK84_14340 [Phreatobacter sp.]|nr:hypothetical protein [Phreatobacter sp.]MBL8570245.1 hypothetical protein [Phreatobacter sp.]
MTKTTERVARAEHLIRSPGWAPSTKSHVRLTVTTMPPIACMTVGLSVWSASAVSTPSWMAPRMLLCASPTLKAKPEPRARL